MNLQNTMNRGSKCSSAIGTVPYGSWGGTSVKLMQLSSTVSCILRIN